MNKTFGPTFSSALIAIVVAGCFPIPRRYSARVAICRNDSYGSGSRSSVKNIPQNLTKGSFLIPIAAALERELTF